MKKLLKLDGYELFEGNRRFEASVDRVAESARTADGTLRVDEVALKTKFTISWSHLPAADTDWGVGRDRVRSLYEEGGEHELRVYEESGSPDYTDYTVRITDYSESVVHRVSARWVYGVSITLEEV